MSHPHALLRGLRQSLDGGRGQGVAGEHCDVSGRRGGRRGGLGDLPTRVAGIAPVSDCHILRNRAEGKGMDGEGGGGG